MKIDVPLNLSNHWDGSNEPFTYRNMEFNPIWKRGCIVSAKARLSVLELEYKPDRGILRIENSLHKYKNREGTAHNHDDFTLQNLKDSISEISDKIGLGINDSELRGLEFGINCTGVDPESFIESIEAYKGKIPYNMTGKVKAYGKRFNLSQFQLKIYNKTLEAKISKGLEIGSQVLRFEERVLRMQAVRRLRIHRVGDLLKPETFINMGDSLAKKCRKLTLATSICMEGEISSDDKLGLLLASGISTSHRRIITQGLDRGQQSELRLRGMNLLRKRKKVGVGDDLASFIGRKARELANS